MLCGTAELKALAESAPNVETFHTGTIRLEEVSCFQLTAEMRNSARESLVPSGLHPTLPAALSLQVLDVVDSPWGGFSLALLRVSCRSGVRARGFTRAAIASTEQACAGLRQTLGFPARPGGIRLRHGYDGVGIEVESDAGARIAMIEAIDPEPMALDDVQYTGTMNLAHTPNGLRLMQVEMNVETSRVERLTARIEAFDGAAFGDERIQPSKVIAASIVNMSVEFPPVRFVCKPDELAFTGTEAV
jgi:hypothetical protein